MRGGVDCLKLKPGKMKEVLFMLLAYDDAWISMVTVCIILLLLLSLADKIESSTPQYIE